MTNPVKHIEGTELTTFEVDTDGSRVHFHVRDHEGSPAELVLPAACLGQLLMTLPRMMREALRKSCGDDSLRVVYPLECYKIELAQRSNADERSGADVQRFILTLGSGGFTVSFAASADTLAEVARSIFGDVAMFPEPEHRPASLS